MIPVARFVSTQSIGGPTRSKIERIKYHIESCILAIHAMESSILPMGGLQPLEMVDKSIAVQSTKEPRTALVHQLSNFSGQWRRCKWLGEGGMCP